MATALRERIKRGMTLKHVYKRLTKHGTQEGTLGILQKLVVAESLIQKHIFVQQKGNKLEFLI